jgi:phospholipid/cholesterol/gamma-HCH transport system substrate-binding protein
MIGAFVIGGVALFVGMIVAFGSVSFFSIRIPVVMYFEGDLSGLDKGAAVNFRGVRIGSVTGVVLELNVKDLSARIPVYAELDPSRLKAVGGPRPSILHPGENMPKFVELGLRARLASESLVTGKLVVQLDFVPEEPPRLVGAEPGYYEIPTIPSTLAELQKSITGVVNMLASAKLPELIANVNQLINDLDEQVKGAQLAAVMSDARTLLQTAQQTVDELKARLPNTLSAADTALQNIDRTVVAARPLIATLENTLKRADQLIDSANATIEPGSLLQRELITTLKDIAGMARSARALADDLEKNPSSILFGKSTARQ